MDSRDLIERRDELKQQILDSFNETFEDYPTDDYSDILFDEEGIQDWLFDWKSEKQEIEAIESLEDEIISDEWEFGIYFIEEDEFEDYVKESLVEWGHISKDFPWWIDIDWTSTAENVKQDYTEVEYQGQTYYYRV